MKFVNQTTGADLDPNNVSGSVDGRKRTEVDSESYSHLQRFGSLDKRSSEYCYRCGLTGHTDRMCVLDKKDGYIQISEQEMEQNRMLKARCTLLYLDLHAGGTRSRNNQEQKREETQGQEVKREEAERQTQGQTPFSFLPMRKRS